jgi:hypothetical protein
MLFVMSLGSEPRSHGTALAAHDLLNSLNFLLISHMLTVHASSEAGVDWQRQPLVCPKYGSLHAVASGAQLCAPSTQRMA